MERRGKGEEEGRVKDRREGTLADHDLDLELAVPSVWEKCRSGGRL